MRGFMSDEYADENRSFGSFAAIFYGVTCYGRRVARDGLEDG
jgi:hypothetical protein